MKLVMLSDQHNNSEMLDRRIRELFKSHNTFLGYIPSQPDYDKRYFNAAKPYFDQLGFKNFVYYDIDKQYNESLTEDIFQCDAIHLSGGNTFYFLNCLKGTGMLSELRRYAINGGVLIGISAGSIMMAKDIAMASYIDENEIALQDLDSMNLVDFHFMPHWKNEAPLTEKLKSHSQTGDHVIYACPDGGGIVLDGGEMDFFGDIYEFRDGFKAKR
ncbi:Type 1 glutamine amidotransferase-like domain-containing protein [Peribacillus sp. SCS-155]|uniref:Type 1 glutamine amidotransferase-like domain-containing protein n=1 Tax=Peribacillus sedimenti TaxID=3115297 RepID=UPI003906A00F